MSNDKNCTEKCKNCMDEYFTIHVIWITEVFSKKEREKLCVM